MAGRSGDPLYLLLLLRFKPFGTGSGLVWDRFQSEPPVNPGENPICSAVTGVDEIDEVAVVR